MVVAAKKGSGSASLCMSAACYRFARSVLEALDGRTGVVEFAYVRSENVETSFFAGPVLLGVRHVIPHNFLVYYTPPLTPPVINSRQ